MVDILELTQPHGFLMTSGKQTAIASENALETDKPYLIVSNGEAFGNVILAEPAQIKTKDFDSEEWQKQHRITQRERRQYWPDADKFFVYRFVEWQPFDDVKLWKDGELQDEPKLSARQWQIVSKSKDLPKQITLIDNAVSITENSEFIIQPEAENELLNQVLTAAYEIEIKAAEQSTEQIEIYSLALIRKPRMRVSKKNYQAQEAQKNEAITEVSEDIKMPFAMVKRDSEFCVINSDTEEIIKCHSNEDDAEAQLVALRINVESEEGESSSDKPKKKPRKKEKDQEEAKKSTFRERLKSLGETIAAFLSVPEPEKTEVSAGVMQKAVNGKLWHFCYSTNAFEDREGEIFSTKSLEDYVSQNEQNKEKGFFNLWHINSEDGNFNTDFARKEWQGVIGRFLVEAGPYLSDEKGKAAKKFFKQFPNGHPKIAPEGWGCSPEFKYLPEERLTGIYKNIWITRTSTLPKMAAANIWTETRQLKRGNKMALSDQQMTTAVEMFGQDFVDVMIRESDEKTQALESAGVAHKEIEKEEESPATEVAITAEQFQNLAQEVAKQFEVNNKSFVDALEVLAHSIEKIGTRIEALENKDLAKDKAEIPSFMFSLQRASEAQNSVIEEDDSLKAKKPAETKPVVPDAATITPDQFFGKV